MKVLVTGANGFVGKNLTAALGMLEGIELLKYDLDSPPDVLDEYCRECEIVYHLAGVNRPQNTIEFKEGNTDFTAALLTKLRNYHNHCPIMLASSIQAELDNPYGKSKLAGEEIMQRHGEETGAKVYIYRFPNLYGKWCRPDYNSVVATFCHHVAHDLPIQVNDPSKKLDLVYIDDVVKELLLLLADGGHKDQRGYYYVPEVFSVTLGELASLIHSFRGSRVTLEVPDMTDGSFSKKLYSTYLSYLPKTDFSYPLKMNLDERGSFTEIIRTDDRGQFSVNITKPGVEKGNHWHNTKNEKFIVVHGKALIQFRKIGSDEIISYHVTGDELQVIDIPVGYTHNITNEGDTDMITLIWCNECYDPEKSDTYFEKVNTVSKTINKE